MDNEDFKNTVRTEKTQ